MPLRNDYVSNLPEILFLIGDRKHTSRWFLRVSSQTKVTKSDSVSPLPYLRPPLPLPLRLLLASDAARHTDEDDD